jgi:hypothetical protein
MSNRDGILCYISMLNNTFQTVLFRHFTDFYQINIVDFLYFTAPAAAIQTALWAYSNGEFDEVTIKYIRAYEMTTGLFYLLLADILLSVALCYVSLVVNCRVGPIRLAVTNSLKDAMLLATYETVGGWSGQFFRVLGAYILCFFRFR